MFYFDKKKIIGNSLNVLNIYGIFFFFKMKYYLILLCISCLDVNN